ncbi:MAG: hypothetical protein P9X24_10240 [Candidatus Hatepunaea meridiana]|nr:hypothetical protein [Candidatus Hatepunaea meridiana]
MIDDTSPAIKVSVWRPANVQRPMSYSKESFDNDSKIEHLDPDRLYEEVYNWKTNEDVWGGAEDITVTQNIRTELIEGFACNLPPQKRTIKKLEELLKKLKEKLISAGSRWSESRTMVKHDEDNTLRANTLISFYNHLRWLCLVFKNVPGVSVTVR